MFFVFGNSLKTSCRCVELFDLQNELERAEERLCRLRLLTQCKLLPQQVFILPKKGGFEEVRVVHTEPLSAQAWQ